MAERVVSPGVFTRERDLSFLEQGVSEIGGAFIGVTPKGPAFIPVVVESQNQFIQTFGNPDSNSYLPYAVQNYLQEASRATVVRVLGLEGYSGTVHTSAVVTVSGSAGERVLAAMHPTVSGSSLAAVSASGVPTNFMLMLSGSTNIAFSSSGMNASGSSASTIRNVFGVSPTGQSVGYTYAFFPEAIDPTRGGIAADSIAIQTSSTAITFANVEYTNAYTPFIQSQTIGGTKYDLFKFHTLNDGTSANGDIKVSLQSIKYPTVSGSYGTFSVLVRKIGDTDQKVEVLEQFDNLTMDPSSPDFIGVRIGNSAPVTDSVTGETYYSGDYANRSSYIRVELSNDAYSVSNLAVPAGFGQLYSTVVDTAARLVTPKVITTSWSTGSVSTGYVVGAVRDSRVFYGYDFASANHTNWSYLGPVPSSAPALSYISSNGSSLSAFSLEDVSANEVDGTTTLSITNNAHIVYRKFTVPFQGGFDGMEPNRVKNVGSAITATNTQGYDLSASTMSGSAAFKKAIDSVSNPESYDINLLVIPGANYEQHPYVVQYAIDMCEDRQDCFYILDLASYSATVATVNELANRLDTNYAAAYYPWIKIVDTNTNQRIWAPPSVALPEVYAYSDNVSAEWFAPAGLSRGGIPGAVAVKSRLPRTTRDELYENKVNPIATFPGQGIAAWGQKTLQDQSSALDRINVRRLLIEVKKFIASTSRYLVFEQNTESTRNRFLSIANPYLASIQERQGLYSFRVTMDDTNNTADLIDRNIMYGQIFLKPTKTAEFIVIDFNILPTGAVFPTT